MMHDYADIEAGVTITDVVTRLIRMMDNLQLLLIY